MKTYTATYNDIAYEAVNGVDAHDALINFMRRDFGGGGSSCQTDAAGTQAMTQTADGMATWFVKEIQS